MKLVLKLALFLRDVRGATTIEYCLIASLITIGLVGAITAWGETANAMFTSLETGGWSASEE